MRPGVAAGPRAHRARGRRGGPAVLVALIVGAVALAGCTGVPSESAPSVIKTVPIGGGNSRAAATTPPPGDQPPNLVADFLQANVLDASEQTSPRPFLTGAARDWSDSTVTVVDTPSIGDYNGRTGMVVVTGRVLGTVSATGIYTPTLAGSSGPKRSFSYGVRLVDGQYRISYVQNPGLLLSETDFQTLYTQRPVYYFDLAHHYLVPDARWTSLTDPTQLADFLVAGLASAPSTQIQNIVSLDTLPSRATAARITVSVGTVTRVEIPGSSQLGAAARNRLADQVAATLSTVVRPYDDIVITDGGRAVSVPSEHGTRFTVTDFADQVGPATPPPYVYYLRNGQVIGQDGVRLRGAVNNGSGGFLQSVAVSQEGTLAIAATVGTSPNARLLVGTQSAGLRVTPLRGPLTRPAFAPGRSEVWVGNGPKLFLVGVDNEHRTQHVSQVGLPSGADGDSIVAVRLSPDGSRVALVLATPDHQQQMFVGAVVRGAGQVRIDTLQQVSPEGVFVTDIAWAEPLKLLAIGYSANYARHIYDVGTDGSEFTTQDLGNLAGVPTTLTIAAHEPPWVTANKAVWEQQANTWLSPGASSVTEGYAPVYLE